MDNNTLYKQNREELLRLLIEIYESINLHHECFLNYDEDKFLFLKYLEEFQPSKDFLPVEDHDVPVPLINLLSPQFTMLYMEVDINLYKIISLIDGVNCVKKISIETDIENSKVKDYVQNLLFHGLIKLVDMFSFSNKYCLTQEIHNFIGNEQMKQECVRFFKNLFQINIKKYKNISIFFRFMTDNKLSSSIIVVLNEINIVHVIIDNFFFKPNIS